MIVVDGVDPIYAEWKSDWEYMMDRFEEQCDDVCYLMRNLEGEEFRNEKWLKPEKLDAKSKSIIAAVIGLEYIDRESEVNNCTDLLIFTYMRKPCILLTMALI